MTETQWERLSALTGVAFAILMAVAFAVQGVLPEASESRGDIVRFFASSHDGVMTGVVIRVAAGIFFLWFVGTLRSSLARAEGGTTRLSAVAYGAGILMLASGIGAMASLAAIAYNAERRIDPALASSFMAMTYIFFAGGAMAMAWLLFATSLVVARTRVFPMWVAATGVAIGALAVVFAIVAPGGESRLSAYPLFILWVVALSAVMFRQAPQGDGPDPATVKSAT